MRIVLIALLCVAACRGRAPEPPQGEAAAFARVVDSLAPHVAAAVGLPFREPPRAALRTRDDVRRYLAAKLAEELPPARARGIEAAYRLFGLIPDSLDLRAALLELLTEQVVGFYDPDSAMLFGVAGAPEMQRSLMAAHELVHALQGQYLPLDSILSPGGDNDRTVAAQAILEGQAMLASIQVLAGERDILADDAVWDLLRQQAQQAQAGMRGFRDAPLVIREGLLFPYIEGADFMRWWERRSGQGDTVPFGPRMPRSSEQVLHPERYAAGDAPLTLVIDAMPGRTLHEDALGEVEVALLAAQLAGASGVSYDPPVGWGGDRYRVVETPGGPALVWYLVFDDARGRERFDARVGARLAALDRPGYRRELTALEVAGRPAILLVLAPEGWEGWRALPGVALRQTGG